MIQLDSVANRLLKVLYGAEKGKVIGAPAGLVYREGRLLSGHILDCDSMRLILKDRKLCRHP